MERCYDCSKPAVANCSGPDAGILWFCRKHAEKHARECPMIADGRAQISWSVSHPNTTTATKKASTR